MKKIFFACLTFLPIGAVLALDFTPRYAESVQDGYPVKRLYFSDRDQRIYLSVPNTWRVSGNGQRGTLIPEKLSQASVLLENSPFNAKNSFDAEGLELYRKAAFGLVPAGASTIQVDYEKTNAVPINGWSSFEMAFSYNFYGQSFRRSVCFINIDKEKQVRFSVEGHKDYFDKLSQQAHATLASWFAPSPELEAVLQRVSAGRK